ncbi:MAG TPA: ABC transporter ATP-binding protein [Bacteroidota bacterium]|nr:ABC transporter ATP-binding protein [Bacteroidota bacterium]
MTTAGNVPAILVEGLSKKFGSFRAVDNLSFEVREGEIFGFLGANGAGKSTTIRMLVGLLEPSGGRATVGGFDIMKQTRLLKAGIGYMSQKFSLYDDLTVEQNIRFFGGVYRLPEDVIRTRLGWVTEMAGLRGKENALTGTLSGGWKQRLALGCAILHKPRIVFLDEPTSGVDPVSRRKFWKLIGDLSEEKTTVLVTTHYLDEAEYCHRLLMIHAGKAVAAGSPEELKARTIRAPILEVSCDRTVEAFENLRSRPFVLDASLFGTTIHAMVKEEREGTRMIRESLAAGGIAVGRIESVRPSLEDVFLHVLHDVSASAGVKS